jgi:Flp pilus assembly protein TadB
MGMTVDMLTILLIVLLVVLLLGGIGGPRYYRGRAGRRTVVREYDDI